MVSKGFLQPGAQGYLQVRKNELPVHRVHGPLLMRESWRKELARTLPHLDLGGNGHNPVLRNTLLSWQLLSRQTQPERTYWVSHGQQWEVELRDIRSKTVHNF